ncbi:hypothetical protein Tco_0978108 [Tanacetum coccineum]|uniref:Uncharacterized protein n=1 Tax=Tanacetum coccineum TaxID=301880 RepID=A0ABQ5EM02_9ASTR
MIQDTNGEAIRGIQEQLVDVPIQEELMALRFRIYIVEAENASLRARNKTTKAIKKITRTRERKPVKSMEQLVTLDETIVLANDLMDQKLRTYVEKSDNKREGVSDLVQKETTHGHNNTLQERHCRSSYKDFQRLLKSMTNLSERIQVRLGLKRKRYAFSVNKAVVVQCTNLSALPDGSEDVVVTVMRPTGFRALY